MKFSCAVVPSSRRPFCPPCRVAGTGRVDPAATGAQTSPDGPVSTRVITFILLSFRPLEEILYLKP